MQMHFTCRANTFCWSYARILHLQRMCLCSCERFGTLNPLYLAYDGYCTCSQTPFYLSFLSYLFSEKATFQVCTSTTLRSTGKQTQQHSLVHAHTFPSHTSHPKKFLSAGGPCMSTHGLEPNH